MKRNGGLGMPSTKRERDDQDLRRYSEKPLLWPSDKVAIVILCQANSSLRENREYGEDKEDGGHASPIGVSWADCKEDPHGEKWGRNSDDIAKNNRKWRRTLPCYTHLESAKVGSDNTSSQGAQDLNDLLGLLRGAIFKGSQQRNLRQLHQNRWWFLRTCCQSRINQERAKMWITSLWKLHTTISKLWRGLPDVGNATHGRQSTKNLWGSIRFLLTLLYPCWIVCYNLVQICQNLYFFQNVHNKITKRFVWNVCIHERDESTPLFHSWKMRCPSKITIHYWGEVACVLRTPTPQNTFSRTHEALDPLHMIPTFHD